MKVKITYVSASYVERWNDGEPCPNNCSETKYPDKQTAVKELLAEGYDKEEIDVDPYDHEAGWWLVEMEEEFDTNDGYGIEIVEP